MMKKIVFLFCFIFFSFGSIYGTENSLENLNYSEVSNLGNIQLRYQKLMEELGCAENVFGSNTPQVSLKQVPQAPNQTLDAYEKECLSHFNSIRRWTILKPASQSFFYTSIYVITTVGLMMYWGHADPYIGGSVINSFGYQTEFLFRESIPPIYNLWKQPPHPVDKFEIQYVKNQCFIPKELWPIIIENLMIARQNVHEERPALNFLSFTLGLTTFKPMPPINFNQHTPDDIINVSST